MIPRKTEFNFLESLYTTDRQRRFVPLVNANTIIKTILKKIARYFVILISIYLGLRVAILPSRMICAELPNGLLIGNEALLNTHRMTTSSIYVFKRADGTTLIPDATDFLYVSKTTVYGLAYVHGAGGKKNYRFAYRPDVDLVFKKKDPETYARLVAEAGPMLDELEFFKAADDSNRLNIDDTWFWQELGRVLIKSPKYRRTDCPLSWYS